MDAIYLESLEQALEATPQNYALRLTLIKANLDNLNTDKALELLSHLEPDQLAGPGDRCLAARVYLAANRAAQALACLLDDDPDSLLLKARALSALDKLDEARQCYNRAVAANSTLEDADLAAKLRMAPEASAGDSGPHNKRVKLRVISNDDTNATEITRMLEPRRERVTFRDVGGLDKVKKQITKKIILPFQKPSLFSKFRKKVGGGILLYGPPGCGKTLLARATAGECNAEFFNVVISDILDMYIGESEAKLHAIFEQARQKTPAVVFFDEVEALAAKRTHFREATSSKLVSQFLSEMDGFAQNNKGVLILAATNVPWALDPAFRRPGRFDRIVFIEPPDKDARREILQGLLKDRPGGEAINIDKIVKQTSGFSGADLEHLVESAVDEAIDASLSEGAVVDLRQKHFDTALRDIKPTTVEWLTTARNYARYANNAGQYNDVLDFLQKHGG